jgi:hypothetical protein
MCATVAQAACGSLPASLGKVTLTVNVPATGPYRVWVRELAPTGGASGFYLQIADAGLCQVTMGNANIPAKTWTWVDYQNGSPSSVVSATISSGDHTIVLTGLSHGTEIDKVELLSDAGCTPTGDGSNCTAAAVSASVSPGPSQSPATSGSAGAPGSNSGSSSGSGSSQPAQQLQAAAKHYFWPVAGLAVLAVVGAGWFIAHRAAQRVATIAGPSPENSDPKPIKPHL